MSVQRLRPVRTGTAILLVAIALVAAACVEVLLPTDCYEPTVTREVSVTAGAMTPSSLEACRDQQVTLVIDPDTNGVFHIHGYDDFLSAEAIEPGVDLRLQFVAGRSGQFPIELHPANDAAGVSIGILTVHEP